MKYFFIFSFLFIAYPSFANDCESIFSRKSIGRQIETIGKDKLLSDFRGQEGYFSLAEKISTESDHNYSMHFIFTRVSKFLGSDFKKLNWQAYQGSIKEAKRLKYKILDDNGIIKKDYYNREGYIKFAEEYFGSDMQKTYINVSTVLDKTLFKKLNWQSYQGSVNEALELRSKILNENGEIKEDYYGMEGYMKFAEEHFSAEMQKTYLNISAVLEKDLFKKLNWQQYQGSVKEAIELRSKILDENGRIKEDYYAMEGYIQFAEKYFAGDMQKTYINISTVLGGYRNMRDLGLDWKTFKGTVEQYKSLHELFYNTSIEYLKYEQGLKFVADKIFKGSKNRAYKNVSSFRESLFKIDESFQDLAWISPTK